MKLPNFEEFEPLVTIRKKMDAKDSGALSLVKIDRLEGVDVKAAPVVWPAWEASHTNHQEAAEKVATLPSSTIQSTPPSEITKPVEAGEAEPTRAQNETVVQSNPKPSVVAAISKPARPMARPVQKRMKAASQRTQFPLMLQLRQLYNRKYAANIMRTIAWAVVVNVMVGAVIIALIKHNREMADNKMNFKPQPAQVKISKDNPATTPATNSNVTRSVVSPPVVNNAAPPAAHIPAPLPTSHDTKVEGIAKMENKALPPQQELAPKNQNENIAQNPVPNNIPVQQNTIESQSQNEKTTNNMATQQQDAPPTVMIELPPERSQPYVPPRPKHQDEFDIHAVPFADALRGAGKDWYKKIEKKKTKEDEQQP